MLTLRRGRVTAVAEELEGLVRLEVDGRSCIAYPRLTGAVALGDEVIVNTQALELELGTGGFDVLYVNLTRGLDLPVEPNAHVMKLPYAPGQVARRHAEEGRTLPDTLDAMPVVCCSLHSQVAPVCAAIGTDVRVAYIQLPGGALPVSLSDTLRTLREREYLQTTVAVGACLDAEVECVSVASALLWAAAEGFDATVCAIGPGIVGTGTAFGHGGLAAAEAANVTHALGGVPVVAIRASAADERERHRGGSHHARAVLRLCLGEIVAAWPQGYDAPEWLESRQEVDVDGWEDACSELPLAHMGRGPKDDPLFFAAAFAAGRVARSRSG
ncbi:MAG: hypothetical protein QOG93_838 [Gaiellaceae bacterium]|jgi:hypothetical protein|nr:hypothetical protein [Gaiellaceae bacterium]MDX6388240.1 hypothetical protein [Gaiellaceae bacterium]